jgi:hypothetical protein
VLEPAPGAVPEAADGFGGRDEGGFGQLVASGIRWEKLSLSGRTRAHLHTQ